MTTTSLAGYEFTKEQNATFMGLVRNLARSGVVAVVASAILLGYNAVLALRHLPRPCRVARGLLL